MIKKNVAIILPKLTGGGAERVGAAVSKYLAEKSKVFIILYDDTKIDFPYGGEIIALGLIGSHNPIKKIINYYKRIKYIKQIKKEKSIDVAISFLETTNFVNILSRQNERVIISVRNYVSKLATGVYGFFYKNMIKIVYNKADLVVSVSKAIAFDLITNYKIKQNKIQVIYNPYSVNMIQMNASCPLENEIEVIFKNPTIINVGRICRQKGQDILINAFYEVYKERKDVNLVFVGDYDTNSPYYKKLIKIIRKLNLDKHIFFLGYSTNPFKYIAHSDLFALTSRFEGFPNALCEAMACGVPVISTDCLSGPREILTKEEFFGLKLDNPHFGEYGVLINNDNNHHIHTDFKKLILYLLSDKPLYDKYVKMGKKRVSCFNENRIMKEYEKLI